MSGAGRPAATSSAQTTASRVSGTPQPTAANRYRSDVATVTITNTRRSRPAVARTGT
jgi:hypothetical protein